MLVKPEVTNFAKIKVIGVGGGGGNAINSMISGNTIHDVDFVVINTDAQQLLASLAPVKVQLGDQLTKGLGAGADPEIGRRAAEESIDKIQEVIEGANMVFVTYGGGGGTGTGAGPIVASIAKKMGILTVAVVTKPFAFEGTRRMLVAEEGIANLRDNVDTLIVIPNQRLIEVVDKKVSLIDAFRLSDNILTNGVQGISDLITVSGNINVDFADVEAIMKDSGSALMGMGIASGENRAINAARQAVVSPLLDVSIQGAKGLLFNITGGPDLSLSEVDEAAQIITKPADPDAQIIYGYTIDENMVDQIKITVVATGFDDEIKLGGGYANSSSYAPRPNTDQDEDENDVPDDKQDFGHSAISSSRPREDESRPETPRANYGSQPAASETKEEFVEEDEWDVPAFLRQRN